MTEEIKIGSIVYLRSGGPTMTVDVIKNRWTGAGAEASCYWIDEHGRQNHAWFPITTLITK